MLIGSESSWHEFVGTINDYFFWDLQLILKGKILVRVSVMFCTRLASASGCTMASSSRIFSTFPVKNSTILSARSVLSSILRKHDDFDLSKRWSSASNKTWLSNCLGYIIFLTIFYYFYQPVSGVTVHLTMHCQSCCSPFSFPFPLLPARCVYLMVVPCWFWSHCH